MAISEVDTKILWGRSGGICSNPDCREVLTTLLEQGRYLIGEMAHVIAKREKGSRGVVGGGSDTYENLILLCPTCHTKIDKAPEGTYPCELLHGWKRAHEANVSKAGGAQIFSSVTELKRFVAGLLIENRANWKQLGPESLTAKNDPGSNLQLIWQLRKLDSIVPNNKKIINAIEANKRLLPQAELETYFEFKVHAQAFEEHQYNRSDSYPRFPKTFSEIFQA